MRNQQNYWIGSLMALLAALSISPVLLAQGIGLKAPGAVASGKPDLSGVWTWIVGSRGSRRRFVLQDPPPLQPWALEKHMAARAGRKTPNDPAREELNPSIFCFPAGVPRNMMGSVSPFEIFQGEDRTLILTEMDNAVRQIWTDGRGHPACTHPGWMGHSVGKWENDIFAVDTVCRNDKTWVEIGGTPNSDALHIVEHMRLVDPDRLEIEFLFEDARAFTKPWGAKRLYQRRTDLELAPNIACEEHLKMGTYREAHWPPEEDSEYGQ